MSSLFVITVFACTLPNCSQMFTYPIIYIIVGMPPCLPPKHLCAIIIGCTWSYNRANYVYVPLMDSEHNSHKILIGMVAEKDMGCIIIRRVQHRMQFDRKGFDGMRFDCKGFEYITDKCNTVLVLDSMVSHSLESLPSNRLLVNCWQCYTTCRLCARIAYRRVAYHRIRRLCDPCLSRPP